MRNTLVKASLLALVVAFAGGCATTEQIAKIQSMAEKAQSTADAAQRRADGAASTASEALDTARRAEAAAQAAQDCCNQNTSRLDKMFEKAMKK